MENHDLVWPPPLESLGSSSSIKDIALSNSAEIDIIEKKGEEQETQQRKSAELSKFARPPKNVNNKAQPIELLQTASREELLTTILALREEKFQLIFEQEELMMRIGMLTQECMSLKNKNLSLEQENRRLIFSTKHKPNPHSIPEAETPENAKDDETEEEPEYSFEVKRDSAIQCFPAQPDGKKKYYVVESKSNLQKNKRNMQTPTKKPPIGGILGDLDAHFPPISTIECDVMEQTFVSGIDGREVRPLSAVRNFVRRISNIKTDPGGLLEGFHVSEGAHHVKKSSHSSTLAAAAASAAAAAAAEAERESSGRSLRGQAIIEEEAQIGDETNSSPTTPTGPVKSASNSSLNNRRSANRWIKVRNGSSGASK